MSRGNGDAKVVHGARVIKHRRWTSAHRGTWPAGEDRSHDSDHDDPPVAKRQKTKRPSKERVVKPSKASQAPQTPATSLSPEVSAKSRPTVKVKGRSAPVHGALV